MAKNIIFSCPECHQEMKQKVRYASGTQDFFSPFGLKEYWLECPECGHCESLNGKGKKNAERK